METAIFRRVKSIRFQAQACPHPFPSGESFFFLAGAGRASGAQARSAQPCPAKIDLHENCATLHRLFDCRVVGAHRPDRPDIARCQTQAPAHVLAFGRLPGGPEESRGRRLGSKDAEREYALFGALAHGVA